MADENVGRAQRLYTDARDDPTSVTVEELEPLLNSSDSDVLQPALTALAEVAKAQPDAVIDHLDTVQELLAEGTPKTTECAALVLQVVFSTRQQAITPLSDVLLKVLGDLTAEMEGVDLFSGADEIPQDTISAIPEVIRVVVKLDRVNPGTIAEALSDLEQLLTVRPVTVQLAAAMGIARLADSTPEATLRLIPKLEDALRPPTSVEDPELEAWLGQGDNTESARVRAAAASALKHIAADYPAEVRSSVSDLATCLAADDPAIRRAAISALANVADTHPNSVRSYTEELEPLLDDPNNSIRWSAALTLARIAKEHPQDVSEYVDELRRYLDADDKGLRVNGSWALDVLSEHNPAAVRPAIDDLAPLLDSETTLLRENVVTCLMYVGMEFPETVRPHRAVISQCLLDESTEVRQKATKTLLPLAIERADELARHISARQD